MIERSQERTSVYYDDVCIRFYATLLFFGACIKDVILLAEVHQHFTFVDYYSAWAAIFCVSGAFEILYTRWQPGNFFNRHVSSFPLVWLVYGPQSYSATRVDVTAIVQNLQFFFVLMFLMNFVYSAITYARSFSNKS